MNVLITGGAGYVGSRLSEILLGARYGVVSYDIGYFGFHAPVRYGLRNLKADIRDTTSFRNAMTGCTDSLRNTITGCEAVIHLASISNDASFGVNEKLSREVNLDCFEPMVLAAKEVGVKRFVYASTSSVYGAAEPGEEVTEEKPFAPLTPYNDYKGRCEPLLLKHASDDFICTVIRPATFCGYSPRMRLDLSVNVLTSQAVAHRKIKVFGGSQMRPNIHIDDMCRLYRMVIEAPPEKVQGQIFNVGHENVSIADLAARVKHIVEEMIPGPPVEIETLPSDPERMKSYVVNSDKVKRVLGFEAVLGVDMAIRDVVKAFEAGKIPNSDADPVYSNARQMRALAESGEL